MKPDSGFWISFWLCLIYLALILIALSLWEIAGKM